MKNFIHLLGLITFSLFSFNAQSQKEIDFLDYDYKYLTEDFQIQIDSSTFQKCIEKYNFYPERIKNYKDSLGIVMMVEFGDWKKARSAELKIVFSWKRLGYYTWLKEDEAKQFAAKFQISHPWRMYELLTDESNNNPDIKAFIEALNEKVEMEEKDNPELLALYKKKERMFETEKKGEHKRILSKALFFNPERIQDFKKLQLKRWQEMKNLKKAESEEK